MRRRALIPSLLGIALIISVIQSVGAPLIPTIAEDFDTSLGAAQWSLTLTLLVGAVVSPVVGRLGDGAQRRRVMLACLAVVVLGGGLAALAGSLPILLVGRALQGFGLALIPLTMAAAREHLPSEQVGPAIAALSVIGPVGAGLGYPITGFIADRFDAETAFWFVTVASALALLVAMLVVPEARAVKRRGSLDVVGAVLIGGGLVALLVAMEKGPTWGWGTARVWGLLAVAAVLLELWRRNELRVDAPLVDLRLVRRRAALTANVTVFVLAVSMYLCMSLMTQYVQIPQGLHGSILVAGLILVPLSAVSAVSTRLMPPLRRRVGLRNVVPIGTACIAAGMLFFAATGEALWQAYAMMGMLGLGLGLTFAALPGLIIASVPSYETSSAMSFYQVTRYVGFAIGSGLAVTLLHVFDSGGALSASAYKWSLASGGAICLLSGLVNWLLQGEDVAGRGADPVADERGIEEGELAVAGLPRLPT